MHCIYISTQLICELWTLIFFIIIQGYKVQLGDCKEQLEQLENCQNQELGKIKHMLLSAETALEIERQKNRDIAFEKQSNLIEDSNVVEKTIEMTEECSTKKHLEIQAS